MQGERTSILHTRAWAAAAPGDAAVGMGVLGLLGRVSARAFPMTTRRAEAREDSKTAGPTRDSHASIVDPVDVFLEG